MTDVIHHGYPGGSGVGEWLLNAEPVHSRLRMLPMEDFDSKNDKPVRRWTAIEKPHSGQQNYAVFASKAVELEIHKAGWRLAELLESSLSAK